MFRQIQIIISILLWTFLWSVGANVNAQECENILWVEEMLSHPEQTYPAECAVSIEALQAEVQQFPKPVLVDVRRKTAFDAFRIPDSINIPLAAIKSKSFLKEKSLILLDEGWTFSVLAQECEDLRAQGFDVRVLFGGLHTWQEAGYHLQGDFWAQQALSEIPPRAFFLERHYQNWIIIDMSETAHTQAECLLPGSLTLSYHGNEQEFLELFEEQAARQSQHPLTRILIVDDQGERYDALKTLLAGTEHRHILFLQGGLKAYQKFLEQQNALLQAEQQKKTVKSCPACP